MLQQSNKKGVEMLTNRQEKMLERLNDLGREVEREMEAISGYTLDTESVEEGKLDEFYLWRYMLLTFAAAANRIYLKAEGVER